MHEVGLRDAFSTSITGQLSEGKSAVLTGPAGVGKSWIARQVATSLDDSWHVEHLSGSPAIQGLAFSGVGHLLPRNTVPAVELLVSAVLEAMTSRSRGRRVLLLLDDLDQLDVGSVAVCHQFHSQGGQILATVRSDRVDSPSVAAILGRNDVARHEVGPLDQTEVDVLLQHELGGTASPSLANQIWQLSRGNPFVVLSILAELETANLLVAVGSDWNADLSTLHFDNLDSHLGIRLDALPERVRYALDLVAIAEPLEQALASELGIMAELAKLEQARLVHAENIGDIRHIRTAHPLIGERVRSGIQTLRRRELVSKLASSITIPPEGRFSPGLVRIAFWAQEVDVELDPKLAEHVALAAFATFDLTTASVLIEKIPQSLRSTEVSIAEAIIAALLGDPERSERVFQRARDAASTELEMARAITSRAELYVFAGHQEHVMPELQVALEEFTALEARARIASTLAIAGGTRGDFSFAMGVADELLDQRGLPPDLEQSLLFANIVASSLMGPRRDLTLRKERMRTLIASNLSWFEVEKLEAARAQLAVAEAEVSSAVAMMDAAAIAADNNGRPSGVLTMGRSLLRMMAWRDDGRIGYAEKSLSLLSQTDLGGLRPTALACFAHALATDGRLAEARQALKEGRAESVAADPRSAILLLRAQSQIAASAGDHAKAASISLEACARAIDGDHLVWGAMAAHDAVRIGHADIVIDILDELVSLSKHCPLVVLIYRHARGVVEGDVSALRSVSADMASAGLRASAVSAIAFASIAASRGGDEMMGNRLALQAHLLLGQDLTTHAPETSRCPNPLSDREQQLAIMVSTGASNRQMANELFLSTRTVENHLGRAFKKLGLSSRSELADLLQT